jgi:4-diphosphocytidyl-2-C-methyl-D-erythritol kinase
MSALLVDRIVVAAPAKINLFLHVTGRRPDGYHLIESLFALVDLADTLTLEARGDDAIVRARDMPGIEARDDLALRAASALRDAAGVRRGVSIDVVKRIPVGGGLGGGSSDAASVLIALNRLWRTGLPREELARIGATLGADVPFFVYGENAVVRGIGEIVKPLSLPRTWIALAIPPAHVSTAAIFSDPALTRAAPSAKIDVFSESYGRNQLESVAASRHPAVATALAALRRSKPHARMTGSGSCVIAACESAGEARAALSALPAGTAGRVVRTLARHPLATLA